MALMVPMVRHWGFKYLRIELDALMAVQDQEVHPLGGWAVKLRWRLVPDGWWAVGDEWAVAPAGAGGTSSKTVAEVSDISPSLSFGRRRARQMAQGR